MYIYIYLELPMYARNVLRYFMNIQDRDKLFKKLLDLKHYYGPRDTFAQHLHSMKVATSLSPCIWAAWVSLYHSFSMASCPDFLQAKTL